MPRFVIGHLHIAAQLSWQVEMVKGVFGSGKRGCQIIIPVAYQHPQMRIAAHNAAQRFADIHIGSLKLSKPPRRVDFHIHDFVRQIALVVEFPVQIIIQCRRVGAVIGQRTWLQIDLFARWPQIIAGKSRIQPADHLTLITQQFIDKGRQINPQVAALDKVGRQTGESCHLCGYCGFLALV